jgi:hypothetical protein
MQRELPSTYPDGVCPIPVFDCKVLTFDVAKVAKPAEQCLLKVRVGGGGEITETLRSLLRRAASGHAAAPPSRVMNVRRFMPSCVCRKPRPFDLVKESRNVGPDGRTALLRFEAVGFAVQVDQPA